MDYNIANQRFDRYLRKYFKPYNDVKLNDIFARIRKWEILVNNKRVKENYRLALWDEIKFKNIKPGQKVPPKIVSSKKDKIKSLELDKINSMIIYEDDNWIVFNKPAGVVAHPSNNHTTDISMNDYLDKYCQLKNIYTDDKTFKPSFGYRLDKNTSGVLIAAKNYKSLQYINQIIRERKIDKEYITIVVWNMPNYMVCNRAVSKVYNKKFGSSRMKIDKNGQNAKSEFWNIKTVKNEVLWEISMVKVKLHTGRMHQIRVHLASEWYPILWDIIYGNAAINRKLYKHLKINRQILHCNKYSFKDLNWKIIQFEAKLPSDFDKLIT